MPNFKEQFAINHSLINALFEISFVRSPDIGSLQISDNPLDEYIYSCITEARIKLNLASKILEAQMEISQRDNPE
jgi:hypothetical protein